MLELILKDGYYRTPAGKRIKGEKRMGSLPIPVNTSNSDASYSLDKEIHAANKVLELNANACFVGESVSAGTQKIYSVVFLQVPKKYLK
jgi:hypothetical protein